MISKRDLVIVEWIIIIGLGSVGRKHLAQARALCPNAEIYILTQHPERSWYIT